MKPKYIVAAVIDTLWKVKLHQFLIIAITFLFLFSGCAPSREKFGVAKENYSAILPYGWTGEFYERDGRTFIEGKSGLLWSREYVRMEINTLDCLHFLNIERDPVKRIEMETERIRSYYSSDSVDTVQPPTVIENKPYKIFQAIIRIPTMAMDEKEDAWALSIGVRAPDVYQSVELYEVFVDDEGRRVSALIYPGNDKDLNTQARNILNTIELYCPTK